MDNKHIQELYKKEERVIVPDLGAFLPSGADDGVVVFNSYLKFDDQKLTSFIAEKESISKDEAKTKVKDYVKDIKSKLDSGSKVEIQGLGTLSQGKDGELEFKYAASSGSGKPSSKSEDKSTTSKSDQPKKKDDSEKSAKSSASAEDKKQESKKKEENVSNAQKKNVLAADQSKDTKTGEKKDPLKHEAPDQKGKDKPSKTDDKKSSERVAKKSKKKEQAKEKKSKKEAAPKKTDKTGKKTKNKKGLIAAAIIAFILVGTATFAILKWDWVSAQLGIAQVEKEDKEKDEKADQGKDSEQSKQEAEEKDSTAMAAKNASMTDSTTNDSTANKNAGSEQQKTKSGDEQKDKNKPAKTESVQPKSGSSGGRYHIIVNSFENESNTQKAIKELNSQGYSASVADEKGGLQMVSAGGFATLTKAKSALGDVKSNVSSDAWIYKK